MNPIKIKKTVKPNGGKKSVSIKKTHAKNNEDLVIDEQNEDLDNVVLEIDNEDSDTTIPNSNNDSANTATHSHKKVPAQPIRISDLSSLTFDELFDFAIKASLKPDSNIKRQDLMHLILRNQINAGGSVIAEGTLEVLQDGYGFLRSKSSNYLVGSDDIYISPAQIRLFGLRTGDVVVGEARSPKDNERFFAILRIESVNGDKPDNISKRPVFDKLVPIFPNERIDLEYMPNKISTRIINLVSPIGKGQRGLIVSPPKAGKTVILQEIANAICQNYPDIELFILLVDERPEEVTDMKRSVPKAEVIASTFDEQPQNHVQVSEMLLEKAKRLVEKGRDVVIMLDSITRLARAYNLVVPASGKILTGGVDSNALYKPKRFFGAARNIDGGGSLTIIATALVDTGSRMDDYIYEEFKGTGNMELHLERKLANRRLFPAINIDSSSTRREDLLLTTEEMAKMWALRKFMQTMDETDVIELVVDKMNSTKDNSEFLRLLNS